jgi:flagellar motor component MotA
MNKMKTQTIINIPDYEENIAAGMTLRQILLSVLGVVLVVASYLMTNGSMHMQAASYLSIGAGLPCFLFAFAKPKGKKLEQFLMIWLRFQLSTRKRVYRSENKLYRAVFEPVKQRKEKKNHAKMETKEQ